MDITARAPPALRPAWVAPSAMSPAREAAIQELIGTGKARSIPHALFLEAAHYIKLPV